MERGQLLDEIRDRLQAAFGDRLQGIVLYGSEARGEAAEDSDIDILVLLDRVDSHLAESRKCAAALLDLSIRLGRPIHARPAAQDRYEEAVDPLYAAAHREGISS